MNCTGRAIRKRILLGGLDAVTIVNKKGRPKYQISISSLPPSAQEKYYAQQRAALALTVETETAEPKASKPFDAYSEAEREEIVFWEHVVQQWGGYARKKGESEAELLERFLAWLRLEYPERSWSKATLYRKRKALEDGDLDGLVDGRGKTKGSRVKLEPEVAEVFRAFYLQETRHPNVQEAMWGAEEYLAAHMPDKLPLPSYSTFYRYAQSIPPQLRELGIYGEKAWRDKYGLYISRDYSNLCSNDYWVSDSHTFDVLSKAPGGKPRKLYLTAFIDARSGIYTGWYVTDNPCAQATLFALRRGIERHGIPRKILSDNGREFLTRDVGGLGHRAKKPKPGAPVDPPPIFKRLGIQLVCAKVRNAQAKPIERKFLDMKGQFSTLWETFTGGNPTEKPECLKKVLKQGHVPTDEEFVEAVDTLISGYFNMRRYSGPIAEDRELKRMDVFHLRMGSEKMWDAIHARLINTNMLIIVDEAQLLKQNVLDELRQFPDGDELEGIPGNGVALIGNSELYERIRRIEIRKQTRSRMAVQRAYRTRDLTKEDVQMLFPQFTGPEQKKELKLLADICRASSSDIRMAKNIVDLAAGAGDLSYEGLLRAAASTPVGMI